MTTDIAATAEMQAALLSRALPYMQRYENKTVVVKYGGHAMGDAALGQAFARDDWTAANQPASPPAGSGQASPRADDVDRVIASHRHKPGNRTQVRHGETIGLRPYLDEDLLKRLLGLPPVPQNTQADAEKFRAGLAIERIERGSILHRDSHDQFGDVLRRHRDETISSAAAWEAIPAISLPARTI